MRSISSILLFLPTLVAAAPAKAAASSTPQIQISSAMATGSGCPSDSFATEISPDKTVITLGFDSFDADTGGNTASSDGDRNCLIFVNLEFPASCVEATMESTFHGFAQVGSGVDGEISAQYSLTTGASKSPSSMSFSGTAWAGGSEYTKQDNVTIPATIRPEGDRNVQLLIQARIDLTSTESTSTGTITVDDATIDFTKQTACR